MAGQSLKLDPIVAFGLYGLLFGGTVPHYFYQLVEYLFPHGEVAFPLAKKMIFERLIFSPIMQAFSLYTLARFEGKPHVIAVKQLFALYWPILQANWKWLTIFQVINMAVIPPELRVLFMNLVGFGWVIFVASMKRKSAASQKKRSEQE